MAIKLYSWPRSSGTRVSWALEELGLTYEFASLDGSKGEHRSASYLAINPCGKVPALVDGDERWFESGAILLHLGWKYGIDKGLWPSPGGQAHADALCLTVWSMVELGPSLLQYAYHGLDSPVSFKPADRSKAAADYALSQFERCLGVLDGRLEGREYVNGNFSLVDIAAASWLMFGSMFGVKYDAHPKAAAWLARCAARPAAQRAR